MSSVRTRYPAPITPNMIIKQLEKNEVGRDFVCGDIHGSFSCVERFLKEINFNKSKDRFICVGDLVDRGPENEKCLEYLYEPWFFTVHGNHELLMTRYFDRVQPNYWQMNGGFWGTQYLNDLSDQAMLVKDAADKMKKLPHLITVKMRDDKKFHVIHAELFLLMHRVTDAHLADPNELRKIATVQTVDGDFISWGRMMFSKMYKRNIATPEYVNAIICDAQLHQMDAAFNSDLSHIYSGHTIVRRPVQFYGQTNLDTMAYGSYKSSAEDGVVKEWAGLTVTEPLTGKFWFCNDREFKEVQPIVFK